MEINARRSPGAGRRLDPAEDSLLRRGSRIAAWALCLLALVLVGPASATSYVYDANGRVIAVTNDAGEAARYVYDVMGNIQKVDRLAADELALFAFAPGRGVSGTQVTLQGHAFATEPTANTVRFAGTPASVLRATASELAVLVPAGAVTGPISVSVGGQTVTSATDFIVDQNARLPRIDTFSPQIASAGTRVTVEGESLYPIAHQTTVRIGARTGQVGTAQNVQLDFVVPPLSASGKVSVSTPYGLALSTQDLLVLPPGVTPESVATFRRVVPDAPATGFTVATPGQQAAILVEAAMGEHLDVQFSGITAGNLGWSLYDPTNRLVASGTASINEPTALLPPATRAGSYLLLVKPTQAPASWNLGVERSRVIVPGGDPLQLTTTVGNQRKRLVFSAAADQVFGLGLEDITLSSGSVMIVTAMARDANLGSATCYASIGGCHLNLRARQAPHTLTFTPSGTLQTFSTRVTLSPDLPHTLQREVPLDLTLARRGQNARVFFDAQAGEPLAFQMTGQATLPAGRSVNYALYKPDGTLLTSANATSHLLLNLPNLPQSGRYTVFVDAEYGAAVSARVMVSDGSGSGGGGQVDGDAAAFATTAGGQSVYFNFTATEADQRIGVGISDLVLSSGAYVNATVYRPDGTSVGSSTCYASSGGCGINVRATVVGRYSVIVQPMNASQTMQLRAWVSSDLQGDIARETPVQLAINRRGQNARLFFDAQAGETLAVQVAGQTTTPAGRQVYYQVYKPDGTLLTSVYPTSSETLRLPTLAATGRYLLFVDPVDGAEAVARITLTTGQQSGMVLDGAQGEVIAPIPGHPALLTFATTEPDQRLGLALSDIQVSTGTYFSLYVYGPNGTHVDSTTCYVSQQRCALNLRATLVGTYSVVATPQSAAQTVQFSATLSNDQRAALVREQPRALSLDRFGQNARLRFNAEADEALAVQITGQSSTGNASVSYTVYKPDGASLTSVNATTHGEMRIMKAPVAGEYVIFVDPANGATAQASVLLTAGNGGDPVIDEGVQQVETTVGGQATFATFEVEEVDQRIGIGISDLLVSSGSYASVYVYRPNGASVASATCYQSYKGCGLNLRAPEVGTYAIVVTPASATQTLRYGVTVSNDLRRLLPRETTTMLDIPQRGQNARLGFTAQAGETLGLQVVGQVANPVGTTVSYQVFKPDGTSLASRSVTSSDTLNLPTLPVSGEYLLFVDPDQGAAATAQLRLTSGDDSGTVIDGDSGAFATTQPGQPTYLTFQAAAGEQLGLGISDLAVSSGSYVSVYVYRPGGASLTSTPCYVSYGGCVLNINATEGGTYSVVTSPQNATQTAQFKATLSRDLRLSLPREQPFELALPRRGQKARLSFSGEAGESLALQVAGQATFPASRSVYYRVYKPDGTSLTSFSATAFAAQELRLPVSGTYQVLVETSYGETVNSRLMLTAGAAVPVDGTPSTVATDYGGQAVRNTFQVTAGQQVGIGLYDLAVSSGSYVSVSLYRPDGTSSTSTTCYTSYQGCKLTLAAAQTGVYSLVVTPQSATQTFTYKVAVSHDVTGAMTLDEPLDVVLSRRGQNARFTFNGSTGQRLSLQIAGQATVPAARTIYYRVYRPDGTQLTSTGTSTYTGLRLPALPVDGTYTVLVDSNYGETVQAHLTVASGSSALQVDGATASASTEVGGQEVYLAFNAEAGQRLGIGLSNLGVSNGTYFSTVVYRPDGNTASATCYVQYGSCEMNLVANATGLYQLYASPVQAAQTIQFTATVSTDVGGTLERDTPLQLSLPRHGQNAWLQFDGTAGESLSLHVTNPVTQPVGGNTYYVVYKPDGTSLTAININAARVVQFAALPTSGTYRISLSPTYGVPLDVGLTLK